MGNKRQQRRHRSLTRSHLGTNQHLLLPPLHNLALQQDIRQELRHEHASNGQCIRQRGCEPYDGGEYFCLEKSIKKAKAGDQAYAAGTSDALDFGVSYK